MTELNRRDLKFLKFNFNVSKIFLINNLSAFIFYQLKMIFE